MCGKLFKMYTLQSHKRNHTESWFSNTLVYRFPTLENKIQLGLGSGWPKKSSCMVNQRFWNNHLLAGTGYCITVVIRGISHFFFTMYTNIFNSMIWLEHGSILLSLASPFELGFELCFVRPLVLPKKSRLHNKIKARLPRYFWAPYWTSQLVFSTLGQSMW